MRAVAATERRPLVGYYVHHVGSGHRHRATVLAERLGDRGIDVVGLSSASRPATWVGDWVRLERDDDPAPGPYADVTAGGRLHWAPLRHRGLSRRTAQVSAWLDAAAPDLLVSDVSQEVALLARLHGVAVLSVLLPGRRDDPAHVLGLEVSAYVVGFWPGAATAMSPGLPATVAERLHRLGGLSRFAPDAADHVRPRTPRGVVLAGSGGGAEQLAAVARAAADARPDWSWRVLGAGTWSDDPWSVLRAADLVVTHAGQNAVAEVAAARVPAVVVPQPRPHDEQRATGATLAGDGWPAVVVDDPERADWGRVLDRARALDGRAWAGWVDGGAGDRFADLVCRAVGLGAGRRPGSTTGDGGPG